MVNEGCRHTPFANLIPLGSAYPPRCSYSPFSLFLENSKVQKNGEPQKSMPLRNRKAERRIRTTPKGAYFPGFPYTLKSFGRWAFNRLIFNDKKKSIFATASLNLQIMTEFFDYFTKNYPQFVPISTTALVCFFVYKFYLKAEGFSKEWTDLKTNYFPKFEERFVKSDDRFVLLIKEMAELRKETNERFAKSDERFVLLIEKSDERLAELRKEMNEQFLEFRKEMNEQFAKMDERLAELRKEMNERFARIEERLAKSDERFVSLIEKMEERFLELRKEMNEQFAELIEKLTVTH